MVCLASISPAASFAAEPPKKEAAKPEPAKKEPRVRPTFECRWTAEPITIDGKADEAAWKNAQTLDRFKQSWLGDDKLAAAPTQARLLWDENGMYFFADMQDGDLFADLTEHDDQTWYNDVFELFFKPSEKQLGYYELQVNAANTQMDIFIADREKGFFERYIKHDPFAWKTAVVRRGTLNMRTDRDGGWSVEGRIPWSDMVHTGGRPAIDENWLFALCRYDYDNRRDKPELSTIAPLTAPDYHQYDEYAFLKFVGPADGVGRPFGIKERVQVTTSTVVGSPDPPLPYRVAHAYTGLHVDGPLIIRRQPDTNLLYVLKNDKQRTPTNLVRFVEPAPGAKLEPFVAPPVDPKDKDAKPATDPRIETLHTFDGTAYDLVFHPKFAENGYVYFGWNGPEKVEKGIKKHGRISRYRMDPKPPYRFDPKSEKLIIEWASNGHNGLAVAFGNDGMLYVTSGDGTSDSDDDVVGQDMTTILAKVLRLDVDHVTPADAAAGRAYSVPKDNPFVGLAGARPETWAYGLRNPWRMAVDPKTGHLWVTQNGQDLFEQTYFVRRGDNFGWSVTEGSAPFYLERKRGPTPIVLPAAEHSHAEARSLTGGVVYHGKKYPDLAGAYIYGDYATGKIWAVRHDGTKVVKNWEIADTQLSITGFGLDTEGELLICDYRTGADGGLYRLEPIPPPSASAPQTKFPRTLSASGLFEPGRGHKVLPGVIPYSVNSQLWSDGTYKERFIALPAGTEKIGHSPRRSWDFPEGTVLIKSFALEKTAGDPKSRRWIETRFFTKQQNEWIGYSYEWNDAQTDATLVEAKGADREFTIADPAAKPDARVQKWHYPSRAECMVCHSRAANYVLGVSSAQLNCEQDYGGVRDNQLRTLAHLGLIPADTHNELHEGVVVAAEARGLSAKEAEEYWAQVRRVAGKQRQPTTKPSLSVAHEMLPRLVDPADKTASFEARARSYLHANCAHCHVSAGGGNAQFESAYWTPAAETRMLDAKPVHTTFGIPDARLIAPGRPESSLLLHRTALRGRGQMPPIASSQVDPVGVEAIRGWIASLPKVQPPRVVDPSE
ncbi:MAG: PQQ-dependent sugar dehydrogenase [Planctomycetia bacterium]|nr:PQQ-dependent sugar dehydrogenase [Planctomycetia bacterium]